MKTIVSEETLYESKYDATEKWHQYVKAFRTHRLPEFQDLKKVYNEMRKGARIIDINKVIKKGGRHDNEHPKLAIAKATVKKVWCKLYFNGTVQYINRDAGRWSTGPDQVRKEDIDLPICFKEFPRERIPAEPGGWRPDRFQLRAPVPIIPAEHLPKKLTNEHYILWEVDEWQMVPPTDPYLLRRITRTLFVVEAAWDLTPLEKSVMAGRMMHL